MLKKFLCIFLSVSIVLSVCVCTVSADDYTGVVGLVQNDINYIKNALDIAKSLVNGDISVIDAYNQLVDNASGLVSDNIKDINPFQTETELENVSNRDYANLIVKNSRDKIKEAGGDVEGSPQIDFNGSSCCAVLPYNKNIGYARTYFGEYGVFSSNGTFTVWNPTSEVHYKQDGSVKTVYDLTGKPSIGATVYDTYKFYGDWRYPNDTPADDKTTPSTTTDPSGLTDTELLDLIEDMLERLILDLPDLSTVEGLLSSILSKLGTLDSDDDAAGLADIKNAIDNLAGQEQKDYTSILDEIKSAINNLLNKEEKDYTSSLDEIKNLLSDKEYNQLLNEINAAIISLGKDNHSDNQEIINLLNDLKTVMNNDGSSTDIAPILSALEKMQKSLDYLCTINTLDTGLDLWDELTETESEFLDEYAGLITTLLPKFGLVPINNMLTSLDAVVLNTNAPSDLVVNLYGEDITFLSADMFSEDAIKYIDIAKIFVSVLLVYSFCLMFRRKIVGGG